MKKLTATVLAAAGMAMATIVAPTADAEVCGEVGGQPPCYTPSGVPYYTPGADPCL